MRCIRYNDNDRPVIRRRLQYDLLVIVCELLISVFFMMSDFLLYLFPLLQAWAGWDDQHTDILSIGMEALNLLSSEIMWKVCG